MAEQAITDKKIITTKELVWAIGIISGWLFQFYSLKMEIREAVLNTKSDNRIYDLRLDRLEDQDKIHDLALHTLAKQFGEIIEAKQVELEKKRK